VRPISKIGLPAACLGIVLAALTTSPASARQDACFQGQGETTVEATRRRDAVGLVRAVNTAQAAAFGRTGRYQPLANVTVPVTPTGFALQFALSDTGYVFSVKDTLDPCRYAYFSDQAGLIYTAQPLR
jgi:hypothetical protein